jgi:hypothetical protein
MILLCLGLPGSFAEWCDAVLLRLARRMNGMVAEAVHPSLDELLGYRPVISTVDAVGLILLGTSASHLVVGARQPDAQLRAALEETKARFVLALDDPRATVYDLALKRDIPLSRITRAVANSCPFLISYVSMEGALALHVSDAASDPRGAAAAIARHLDIQVNEAEIAGIVGDLAFAGIAPRRSENGPHPNAAFSEAGRKMVDGALAAYAQYFAERSMGPIIWTRDLFILGEDGTRQPTRPLDISGGSRILIYGPYVHLPPGRWSARVLLGFSKESAGYTFFVDVFAGAQIGVTRVQPAGTGIFDAEITFSLEGPHDIGIEIRVVLGEMAKAGQMAFGHVVLTPVATETTKTSIGTGADFMAVLDL